MDAGTFRSGAGVFFRFRFPPVRPSPRVSLHATTALNFRKGMDVSTAAVPNGEPNEGSEQKPTGPAEQKKSTTRVLGEYRCLEDICLGGWSNGKQQH